MRVERREDLCDRDAYSAARVAATHRSVRVLLLDAFGGALRALALEKDAAQLLDLGARVL